MAMRWNAQASFRAASQLESTTRALLESAKELETAADDAGRAAAEALKEAQRKVLEAREALRRAAAERSHLQVVPH